MSLLLCVAAGGMWIRSYIGGGGEWVWHPRKERVLLKLQAGEITVFLDPNLPAKPVISYWQTTGFTLICGTEGGRRFVQVLMPLWMPTLFFLLFPLIRAVRLYRMRPAVVGVCPSCGYDLRATPSRCPEC